MIQVVILGILTLVVFYGLSFIVDMLFRRWWANLVAYLFFLVYIGFHIRGMNAILWILVVLSLVAVLIGAWNIRQLRDRGYKMFQEKPSSR